MYYQNRILILAVLLGAITLVTGCGGSGGGGGGGTGTLSDNARLSGIQLSVGQLDQIFQSTQIAYTGTVGYLARSIQITADSEDANATMTIDGIATASGVASNLIELAEGVNSINVLVKAQDGINTQSYSLDITRQDAQTFAQRAYIKASNTGGGGPTGFVGDWFGFSAALSGDTLAVGAINEDSNGVGVNSGSEASDSLLGSGAVYVFTRTNGVWSQQAYIKASNTGANDQFGFSVALSGDTLAVGAVSESSNGDGVNSGAQADNSLSQSGAVYVFTRTNGVWSQQAYIKASNTGAVDFFGHSVALSGDTLAVSASREDSSGTGVNSGSEADNLFFDSGAVYLFTRANGVWSQQAYIKASNTGTSDQFGFSVALSGDTLAVGAVSESSDGIGVNSGADTQLTNPLTNSGAVYLFARTNGAWSQQTYIKASNTGTSDQFGSSVALSGDTLAVGAIFESSNGVGVNSGAQADNSLFGSGAVYVFTRTNGVWSQQAFIKAANTGIDDHFSSSVALSGDTLAVGASRESSNGVGVNSGAQADNSLTWSGAVYLFTRTNGAWSQQTYIKASNTGTSDQFGSSAALSGDTLAVGAVFEESNGIGVNSGAQSDNSFSRSGAVYVLR